MKTIRGPQRDCELIVPQTGYRARFAGHRATVPDRIAEKLLTLPGFSIVDDQPIRRGARICLIRDGGLGDVLLLQPLLRKLREIGCRVMLATQPAYGPLFDGLNLIDRAIPMSSYPDPSEWDAVVDLCRYVENEENNGRFVHRAIAFAQACDVEIGHDQLALECSVTDYEERRAHLWLRGRPVGYVWQSNGRNRNWSECQHRRVISASIEAGYDVAIFRHDRLFLNMPRVIDLSGRFENLRIVAALLSQCGCVVTPDTGLFHLASALGVPTVAYFGSTPAEYRSTHRSLTVLNNPDACSEFPCRRAVCTNRDEHGMPRCLAVAPERIVEAVHAAYLVRS